MTRRFADVSRGLAFPLWNCATSSRRQHEIGNRTYIVADVEPLDVDGVRTVEVGTALWLLGFLALLPFYGRLEDAGHRVVAVDLPGRIRTRPVRAGVLPTSAQGAHRRPREE